MKHKPIKQSNLLKLKEGKIERIRKICDRCGEGTYMAEHSDRFYCGKCRMTIWKTKSK